LTKLQKSIIFDIEQFLFEDRNVKMSEILNEQMTGRSPAIRYDKNPFVENMIIPVKGKNIRVSAMGLDDNILINQSTGEMHGTHIVATKKVDDAKFLKLFAGLAAHTFDFKSAGIKAFNVLIWVVQEKAISRDLVPLDRFALDEFLDAHKNRKPPLSLSLSTFARGIVELENAKIIAKHIRQGWYFINPNFIFNGDRIAFTHVLEREKKEDKLDQLINDINEKNYDLFQEND